MLQLGIASLKRSKAWVLTGFFCGGAQKRPPGSGPQPPPAARSPQDWSGHFAGQFHRTLAASRAAPSCCWTSAKTRAARKPNRGGRRLPCSRPGAARPGGRPPWSSACRRCGRLPYLTFFQRSSLAPERPAQSPHCVDNSAHVINRCSCLSAGSTSSTCACRARRPASLATHVLTSWQAFLGLGQVTWPGALAQPESSSVL